MHDQIIEWCGGVGEVTIIGEQSFAHSIYIKYTDIIYKKYI